MGVVGCRDLEVHGSMGVMEPMCEFKNEASNLGEWTLSALNLFVARCFFRICGFMLCTLGFMLWVLELGLGIGVCKQGF